MIINHKQQKSKYELSKQCFCVGKYNELVKQLTDESYKFF